MGELSSEFFDSARAPTAEDEIKFACNVCGHTNSKSLGSFGREAATCDGCCSNVRSRAMLRMLAQELFGARLALEEFPTLKGLRGLGLSDSPEYAKILAEKFDYQNTFLDREPQFDLMNPPERALSVYDFIIASEVFEHVPSPILDALRSSYRLLKPNGVLLFTVPYTFEPETTEHYPDLYEYSLAEVGGRPVLINRTRDGRLQVFDNPIFHGGAGLTVEMRRFSEAGLRQAVEKAGFQSLCIHGENYPPFGIVHHLNWSLPMAARKAPFLLTREQVGEVLEQFRNWQQGSRGAKQELTSRIEKLQEAQLELEVRLALKEEELEERNHWALRLDSQLQERSVWASQLRADLLETRAHLDWLQEAAWTKVGRFLRLLSFRSSKLR